MPVYSRFKPLPQGYEPTAKEVAKALISTWESSLEEEEEDFDNAVVFAGLGEPLLRLDVMRDTIALIKSSGVKPSGKGAGEETDFRVITNGLFWDVDQVVKDIKSAGVTSCTVSLNYPTPSLYNAHMFKPPPYSVSRFYPENPLDCIGVISPPQHYDDRPALGFNDVLNFIRTLSNVGVKVTATAVDNGITDVGKTEVIARENGAEEFKVRTYVK
ncbi:hypothetical protein TrCOL_g11354 [Triparma columacea]|uniref:Uncharacterized protein n=1 Tax=Triparma columacea TaxID=722753 RepID=A0A9W7LC64_9STRA|nr:hypothetical protein TrCOL_g11354 [Triparma columacea]